jgi:2'-5' RNA ligase
MRIFVAVPLSAAVIDELSTISGRLRSREDGLRWSAPESWHITVQFLGNTGPEQLECIVAQFQKLHVPPIPIQLENLDFFDRAGIFFASVRITSQLLFLWKSVTTATKLCGVMPEDRPYQPHITLARGKGNRSAFIALRAKLPRQPIFTRFIAKEFLLYESFLGPAGARHEVRERFQLNGALPA